MILGVDVIVGVTDTLDVNVGVIDEVGVTLFVGVVETVGVTL